MCESCLQEEIGKQIDEYVEIYKQGKIDNIAPKVANPLGKPIKGLDYYIENGCWVFTSWSHLKRGYCCGSGCRHCPYPKAREK